MSLTASPCLYIFGLWLTLAFACRESQSFGFEDRKAGHFYCILPIPFCFCTDNQIIGNSLLLTLIPGTYLISLVESEVCCPIVSGWCDLLPSLLFKPAFEVGNEGLNQAETLELPHKFPLLWVPGYWQLMKLPVLQDTTQCRKVELSGFRLCGATDAVPFLL